MASKRKAGHAVDKRDPKQVTLLPYLARAGQNNDNHNQNPSKKDIKEKPSSTNSTSTTSTTTTSSSSSSSSSSTSTSSKLSTLSHKTSSSKPSTDKVHGNKPLFFVVDDIEDVLDDAKPLSKNKSHYTNKTTDKTHGTNTDKYTTNSHNSKLRNEGKQSYGKYVKMPYDPKNTYICPHTSEKRPKWELITSVLHEQINSASEFQDALLAYNPTHRGVWSFVGMHQFVNAMDMQERTHYFSHTLPAIVDLALALPTLMNDMQLPVLLSGSQNQRISLTQHQVASLLANAFLCTFPRRNKPPKVSKYYSAFDGASEGGIDNMPTINFSGLFGKSGKPIVNKLRCIANYFRRVTNMEGSALSGPIDFERRHLTSFPDWDSEPGTLQSLHVYSEGAIEDSDPNFMHVDFSNKYIGGGVLGRGCVQEEIMFCIYPELIVARLFNAMLSDNECCIFSGAEKYSIYSGYSDSFLFVADHKDTTPRDSRGRKLTKIVAMDALNFKYARDQYEPRPIMRELNKCYCAFFNPPKTALRPISTGNWGCGAFNGDLELKAVIQLMAAAACNRTLHYFTFENSLFANNLGSIHSFLVNDAISVGELYDALGVFCIERSRRKEDQTIAANSGVFNFLQLYFTNKKS